MKRDAAEQVIEPDLTEIYSESGIVVRLKDGKVMTQFNQNERIFPASLTKIMTCIIAIEHIEDLEETVVISPERYNEFQRRSTWMASFSRAVCSVSGMTGPWRKERSRAAKQDTLTRQGCVWRQWHW